ncbi:hypothetical protein [Kluyvera intermedia]|uniref:hypothetical protein n=1 Tax=Kluyvera intermedia TaxID=61648 RepID=UPI00111C8FF0|nr:hypothetical protein [Kluyvera intermedia]
MMTIHDISLLDNWHGTRTCGIAGEQILNILKKHNITPEFDVQYLWDDKGNLKDLKFIICGIPHNSLPEERVMELIFSEINPSYLPELWKDYDFQRINREHATKEFKECLERISEYEEYARTNHSNGHHRTNLISKHSVFDFIF